MKVTPILMLASLTLVPLSGESYERQRLTTIFTGKDTESARPFYEDIEVKNEQMKSAVERARDLTFNPKALAYRPKRDLSTQAFFPVRTEAMRPAAPQVKQVDRLAQPIFVIGMDRLSLQWLRRNLAALQEIKAIGLVVEASDYQRFALLQKRASKLGIELNINSGEALAAGYDITTYPTLLIGVNHAR